MFGCGSLFLLLLIGNRRRVRLNACSSNDGIKMNKKLIQKIKDIVEDHLCNTINKIELCEDTHDHYLLGKWDLAQEINELLIKQK
jgi:hypothetical protein